jgi:hypothetical protein
MSEVRRNQAFWKESKERSTHLPQAARVSSIRGIVANLLAQSSQTNILTNDNVPLDLQMLAQVMTQNHILAVMAEVA